MQTALRRDHHVELLAPVDGLPDPRDIDVLLVGGPTHAHGASEPLKTALAALPKGSLAGARTATFDTRFDMARILTARGPVRRASCSSVPERQWSRNRRASSFHATTRPFSPQVSWSGRPPGRATSWPSGRPQRRPTRSHAGQHLSIIAAAAITTTTGTRPERRAASAAAARMTSAGATIAEVQTGVTRAARAARRPRIRAGECPPRPFGLAEQGPERKRTEHEQERWQEVATRASAAPGIPDGAPAGHCAEVGREREERPRHGLGRPVAGQETGIADPTRIDDRRVKQRQDHMAAAEDEAPAR